MNFIEIREAFLNYFKSKGHEVVASSSLVPTNDPTLLFSNAGMNQFKDLFLGSEKRSYSRATTSQKCLRISGKHNDLENVGVTARHHTFFEMLGNFSFGDYFKEDAITYAWEFVTKVLKLDTSKIWITIFETDDETADLWVKCANVPRSRIIRLGEKDNFWAMGDTGPCGPCTEIHYYIGNNPAEQSEEDFKKEDGRYVEFWNLVFMQYERSSDGKLTPLPKPCVDTGMGLERIAAIKAGFKANYDISAFRELITVTEKLSGFKYDGASYVERDLKTDKAYARDVAMRVIADHSRASAFLVADGVAPSNEGRGYVLRRLIRRAARHARNINLKEPFLFKVCDQVISMMGNQYPDLKSRRDIILKLVEAEEKKFLETLDAGLDVLESTRQTLKSGEMFPGEKAFLLHDTYGFPLDLTEDALKVYGMKVDIKRFEREMTAQKERSRQDRADKGITFTSIKIDAPKTEFLGYSTLQADTRIAQVIQEEGDPSMVSIICEATPFYAESGGQVGDTGLIEIGSVKLKVLDTQRAQQSYTVHHCQIISGGISQKDKGARAILTVDADRRGKIKANHSATHIVHAALRAVLGSHVKQAGSRVDENSLRFDFSHFEPIKEDEILAIQDFINSEVRINHEVITQILPIEEAKKTGAVALFGEKYGDTVRVVQIGPKSIEFCGGTHTTRAGDIGYILVGQEGGVSAGVRRIECFAGYGAHLQIQSEYKERLKIGAILKSEPRDLAEKIEKIQNRIKTLERELRDSNAKVASAKSGSLVETARTSPSGIKVVVDMVEGADPQALRAMVDDLRNRLKSGVVALGSKSDNAILMVAGVTSDLTSKINAGNLIKEASKITGARGGGKADFAQAGGGDPSKLSDALERLYSLVE
jgi:alanyl-tRNA synthetase